MYWPLNMMKYKKWGETNYVEKCSRWLSSFCPRQMENWQEGRESSERVTDGWRADSEVEKWPVRDTGTAAWSVITLPVRHRKIILGTSLLWDQMSPTKLMFKWMSHPTWRDRLYLLLILYGYTYFLWCIRYLHKPFFFKAKSNWRLKLVKWTFLHGTHII